MRRRIDPSVLRRWWPAMGLALVWQTAAAQVAQALTAIDRRDCEAAVAALNDGMREGEAQSFFVAGQLYELGTCVRKDAATAASLYEGAARRGDIAAAGESALIHGRGASVPQSYARAGYWFAVMRREVDVSAAPDLAVFSTPAAVVRTYVDVVHGLAEKDIAYPADAMEQGVHAVVVVRFDPRAGRAEILDSSDNRGSSATSFGPSRHRFESLLADSYATVVATLPRPPLPPDGDLATQRRVVFDRDHNDREPQRGLIRGTAGP